MKGANPDSKTREGQTCLHLATEEKFDDDDDGLRFFLADTKYFVLIVKKSALQKVVHVADRKYCSIQSMWRRKQLK